MYLESETFVKSLAVPPFITKSESSNPTALVATPLSLKSIVTGIGNTVVSSPPATVISAVGPKSPSPTTHKTQARTLGTSAMETPAPKRAPCTRTQRVALMMSH